MFPRILFAMSLLITTRVHAAEYGALVGGHLSNVAIDGALAGGGTGARFGLKVGLLLDYDFGSNFTFRTGTVYDQRHVALTDARGAAATAMFEYIDVPAVFRYALNDRLGGFAGALLGINIRDKLETPHAINRVDPNINGLIPLLTVGARVRICERWSVEAYYERGLTRVADNLKNYSGYGMDVVLSF